MALRIIKWPCFLLFQVVQDRILPSWTFRTAVGAGGAQWLLVEGLLSFSSTDWLSFDSALSPCTTPSWKWEGCRSSLPCPLSHLLAELLSVVLRPSVWIYPWCWPRLPFALTWGGQGTHRKRVIVGGGIQTLDHVDHWEEAGIWVLKGGSAWVTGLKWELFCPSICSCIHTQRHVYYYGKLQTNRSEQKSIISLHTYPSNKYQLMLNCISSVPPPISSLSILFSCKSQNEIIQLYVILLILLPFCGGMAYALERSHILSVRLVQFCLCVDMCDCHLKQVIRATPLSQEVLLSPLPTDAPEMASILTSVTKD